jgi:hypothetical protein
MAKTAKSTSKPQSINKDSGNNKRIWWIAGILLIALAAVFYVRYNPGKGENTSEGLSPATTPLISAEESKPDLTRLVGRWLRPDGGYILEIRSAGPDGKLDVGYYNPNPIHVGRAQWVEKDGKLYVMAELQDVNYPGSTYGLEYIAGQDRLSGTYYQAVEKSTFDVDFVREK